MNINKTVFIAIAILIGISGFSQQKYAIVIHGGAGVLSKSRISNEQQNEYKAKLNEALEVGEKLLKEGVNATNIVVKVINVMENSPLFNAGKGAVFAHNKRNELDASIMEGKTLNAGAVAGVDDIKNPINAAREVMYNSKHVLLSGEGASELQKSRV